MDVVFVIDNTGSMTDVIGEVQQQVNVIADAVTQASNGDYQFGLVTAPRNDVVVLLDLGKNNRDAFGTAAAKMATDSSCGEPAAWDDGIDTVVNGLAAGRKTGGGNGTQVGTFTTSNFRASATKIIIVISDARPNHTSGCDYTAGADDQFVLGLAAKALTNNIRLATVFVPTPSAQVYGFIPTIQALMSQMADGSDGIFLQTQPDASDLASVIEDIIANCGAGRGLIVNPTDVQLGNREDGNVTVTNYRPGKNPSSLVYTADGLPSDSTVSFTRITPPDIAGTDQQTMKISVGPDTTAGSYILNVHATDPITHRVQSNYVFVGVDCRPPMILSAPGNQPASATADSNGKASLKVVPFGSADFKYQWYQGPSGSTYFPIAGATSSTFTTPAVTAPADFWVRVTNACGSIDSATATVTPR
ncbi:MAG TPA: hypothetical protein VH087_04125 [Thermoanaerobaculia bacterium]|nr:hypothetical protein [Thermoanaerobaculia bacterium]